MIGVGDVRRRIYGVLNAGLKGGIGNPADMCSPDFDPVKIDRIALGIGKRRAIFQIDTTRRDRAAAAVGDDAILAGVVTCFILIKIALKAGIGIRDVECVLINVRIPGGIERDGPARNGNGTCPVSQNGRQGFLNLADR